jgi:hypothetical protein
MTDLKTYTLKDPTVEAWQWNKPGDCPGVVETGYGVLRCRRCAKESEMTKHGEILIAGELVFVCPDAWIIKRGDTYEVMPDAEFRMLAHV